LTREKKLITLNVQNPQAEETAKATELARRAQLDLPGLKHETKDVLQQLNANIQLIEDLSGRLSFVLSEVRGLIRR